MQDRTKYKWCIMKVEKHIIYIFWKSIFIVWSYWQNQYAMLQYKWRLGARVTPLIKKSPLKTKCEGRTFQKENLTEDMPLCFGARVFIYKGDYKFNYLSDEFYARYNNSEYPEIENKDNRPYMVLLIIVLIIILKQSKINR